MRKKETTLFLYATFKLSIATFSSTMRACVQDQFSHIVCLPLGPAPFFIGQRLFQPVYCFVKILLPIVMFSIKNYKQNWTIFIGYLVSSIKRKYKNIYKHKP